MGKSKLLHYNSILFAVWFSFFSIYCSSIERNVALTELDLKTRKIELRKFKNTQGYSIEIFSDSNITGIHLSDICSKFKISRIYITGHEVNDLFFENWQNCDLESLQEVAVSKGTINQFKICSLIKESPIPNKILDLTSISIKDDIKNCFPPLSVGVRGFAIDDPKNFTGEQFCELTSHLSEITFFRSFNTPFSRKDLQCILAMPKLEHLMLQNWKGARTSDFRELVKKYELKYKRKLQADVEDPTSYER